MPARRRATGALVATVLLSASCAGAPGPAQSADPSAVPTATVSTLATLDGWEDHLSHHDPVPFAVLEIAYDEQVARAMWTANVADLPAPSRGPLQFGLSGDLADVDLSTEVLALYSSGQSGSCPTSVTDVRTADTTVAVTTVADLGGGDGCTDDFQAFRALVALDRDDVPSADEIGAARLVIDEDHRLAAVVGAYPLLSR